jgi:hypothetical protein
MKTDWRPGDQQKTVSSCAGLCLTRCAKSGREKDSRHTRSARWHGRVGAGAGIARSPSRWEPVSAIARTVPGLGMAQPYWPNQRHGRARSVAQVGGTGVGGAARAIGRYSSVSIGPISSERLGASACRRLLHWTFSNKSATPPASILSSLV